jgi:hypothetical protein
MLYLNPHSCNAPYLPVIYCGTRVHARLDTVTCVLLNAATKYVVSADPPWTHQPCLGLQRDRQEPENSEESPAYDNFHGIGRLVPL